MTIINASPGYHNLKLNKKSSSLTTFTCQFDRYRVTRLSFGVALAGDMFQWKLNKIFKDLPNIFGIADDILIVSYDVDGIDPNKTLKWVMQICQEKN